MHTKYFRHISHFWPKIYIHKALQKGGVLYSLSPLVKVGPYQVHLFWPLHFKKQNGYDLLTKLLFKSNPGLMYLKIEREWITNWNVRKFITSFKWKYIKSRYFDTFAISTLRNSLYRIHIIKDITISTVHSITMWCLAWFDPPCFDTTLLLPKHEVQLSNITRKQSSKQLFFYVNETLKRYSAKTSYLTYLQPQSVLFQEAWTLQGNLKNAYLKIGWKVCTFLTLLSCSIINAYSVSLVFQ